MSDDYQQFRDRIARNFAEMRELEEAAEPTPPQPQPTSYALPITDAQLDARCDARIEKFFAKIFTDPQAEVLVEVIADMRQEWQQKLGELRKEIESLRGGVKSNNVELIKRGSNVA